MALRFTHEGGRSRRKKFKGGGREGLKGMRQGERWDGGREGWQKVGRAEGRKEVRVSLVAVAAIILSGHAIVRVIVVLAIVSLILILSPLILFLLPAPLRVALILTLLP